MVQSVYGRIELGYFGVNPFGAVKTYDADPVMAVFYEVEFAEFVECHRRQLMPEPEG